MLPEQKTLQMNNFDNYIGKVQGYFSERYPSSPDQLKLKYTEKYPRISLEGVEKGKTIKFSKVAHLDLDELDHFINFMLHDITIYSNDSSGNLMQRLASNKNTELYQEENKYSIIFPNKQYHGEFTDKKA